MNDPRREHDAPVVALVARLHAGASLRERVVRLRWKRRKPVAATVATIKPETNV